MGTMFATSLVRIKDEISNVYPGTVRRQWIIATELSTFFVLSFISDNFYSSFPVPFLSGFLYFYVSCSSREQGFVNF